MSLLEICVVNVPTYFEVRFIIRKPSSLEGQVTGLDEYL